MPYKIGHKKRHSEKWDRCVKDVKAKNENVNAYAVCTSSLGKKSYRKK